MSARTIPGLAVVLLCATHTPDFLIGAMRAGVREVLPSPRTDGGPDRDGGAGRGQAARHAAGRHRQGARLRAAARGAAAATFLAANVAHQLAERSSVLLVDLNLQFGDAVSLMHDGAPASTLVDVARGIARLDATLLAASAVR